MVRPTPAEEIESMRPTILLICVLIASTVPRAHAQGVFVPAGRNGSGIELFYSGSGQGHAYGVTGGYSISGRFDFDLTVAQLREGKITELGAGVRYHFLKETDHSGVDLSLAGSYFTYLFGRQRYTGNSRGIELALNKTIAIGRKASFLNMLSYGYGWTSLDLKDRYGYSDKKKESAWALSLGFGTAFYRENSSIIAVMAGVFTTKGHPGGHVSLALIGISGR